MPALQSFMESLHSENRMHWDHELPESTKFTTKFMERIAEFSLAGGAPWRTMAP